MNFRQTSALDDIVLEADREPPRCGTSAACEAENSDRQSLNSDPAGRWTKFSAPHIVLLCDI